MIEISLKRLPLPCPINQLYRAITIKVRGKLINKSTLSARARKLKRELCTAIVIQLRARPMIDRPCSLTASFTPPDCRRRDADGYIKQLQDALEDCGVVTDDSLFVQVNLEMMPTPQRPGWCDVTVSELP